MELGLTLDLVRWGRQQRNCRNAVIMVTGSNHGNYRQGVGHVLSTVTLGVMVM